MIEVAIIKHKRNVGNVGFKIKEFNDYSTAQKFVNEFNIEDKQVKNEMEYATVIINS